MKKLLIGPATEKGVSGRPMMASAFDTVGVTPSKVNGSAVKSSAVPQQEMALAMYHFVTTMGSLLRNLKRSQELFPNIKPACDKAQHLFAEGKLLRDMIEHADQYIEGKGKNQADFIREAEGVGSNFPGSSPGIVDAISTYVDKNGHWLGGRLNVERVLAEVKAIQVEVEKIPQPQTVRHAQSMLRPKHP
jgi:hypothetical protein